MKKDTPGQRFRNRSPIGSLVLLLVLSIPARVAQPASLTGSSVPWLHRAWDLTLDGGDAVKVEQDFVPLGLKAGVSENLAFTLDVGMGSSSVEGDTLPASRLEGPSVPMLGAQWQSAGRRLAIEAAVGVPIESDPLSPREQEVARILSLPVLGFPLRQPERGFVFGISGSHAFPLSESATWSVGIGGTYRGSYVAVEGEGDYRPAPEWAVTTGVDLDGIAGPVDLRLDATVRGFGADTVRDTTVFEEGGQLELHLDARIPGESWGGRLELRGTLKSENETPDPVAASTNVLRWHSGNGFLARLGVTRMLGSVSRVGLQGEALRMFASDVDERNGHTFAVGPWVNLPVLGAVVLRAEGAYLRGKLDSPTGGNIDAEGFHAAIGLGLVTR